MNLHGATSATQDDVRAAFQFAFDQAERVFTNTAGDAVDPYVMERRNAALLWLLECVNRIGKPTFEKTAINKIFGEDAPIIPFRDWPMFVVASALDYCHEAVMNGDGVAQSGMGSLADGLKRLREAFDHPDMSNGLVVTNGHPKMAWHPLIQREIELRLASQNVTGHWSATVTADNRVLIRPSNNTLDECVVQQPAWFEYAVVDDTVVPASEADRFRVERGLQIGLEVIELQARVAALMERQRKVLLPYMG